MILDKLLTNNSLWIVDVGASGGIHSRWSKATSHYNAVLFEPDQREYEALKSTGSGKENLIILNSALSDSVRQIDFNLCRKQQVSSVYLPNFSFLNKFPDPERFEVIKTVKIQADTLDNQLQKNNVTEVDFIKIDTEGYELSILKGASSSLENAIGLELEVEFVPLRENQPLFKDVDDFVRKAGFELFDIKRYFWKRKIGGDYGRRKGQLVFADTLYLKTPENLLLTGKLPSNKIIKSICVYLVFGYLDLAAELFHNTKAVIPGEVADSIAVILSKFKDTTLPEFRGKGRLQNLFQKMTNILSSNGPYSGTDSVLGNP